MARARRKKTSDVPTRIYSYRCLPPVTEHKLVEDQFRLAHQYSNALIEVERWLRGMFRSAQLVHPTIGPALLHLEDAQAAVDDAYDDIRAAKSGTATPDMAEPIAWLESAKDLRATALKEIVESKLPSSLLTAARKAMSKLAEARPSADPEKIARAEARATAAAEAATIATPDDEALLTAYNKARVEAYTKRTDARRPFIEQGLRPGTYDRVENAVRQAAGSAKRPLRFDRFDGTGSIGTQLIGGLTVSELLSGQDTRLRLGAPGEADAHPRAEVTGIEWSAVPQLPRNLRRHTARTYVDLRLGSNKNQSPIFARFPVTLHRPLPNDAVIKWAYVVRRRVGRRYEWRFQVTLESETFRPCTVPIGEGACAIDLGWRRLFDADGNQVGLRVGYLVDETGREREIRVPDNMMARMTKVYDLASIRAKEFDGVRARLVTWLQDREVPTWMAVPDARGRTRITGLAQWRDPRKLQALVDAWAGIDWDDWRAARAEGRRCNPADFSARTNRIAGDRAILTALQAWARQDRHLQNWQEHQRERMIAHRREWWHVIAAELTRTYATILIENGTNTSEDRAETMKLPDIPGWERPAPEDGNPSDGREQRRMSRLAAPGELRVEIIKASSKHGAQVTVEETVDSTVECAWCSSIEEFDAAAEIEHVCSSCGRMWNQDANAARNLLHRHGFPSGPVPPIGVEVPEAA